jgi:peptidoglycan/LPS O-acetylase OafA/YrhL
MPVVAVQAFQKAPHRCHLLTAAALPLLLLLVRRVNARAMVGLVAAIVVTIGLLGPHVPLMNSALVKFTPNLAVLFAVGLLAAGSSPPASTPDPGPGPVTRWPPRCRPSC